MENNFGVFKEKKIDMFLSFSFSTTSLPSSPLVFSVLIKMKKELYTI
jgi:hypothetical protein